MAEKKTHVELLADFVTKLDYKDLDDEVRARLKLSVLDSIGCAIAALNGPPVQAIRQQVDEFGGNGLCTLIGGGQTAPDRAAFYNGALLRYVDFMDNYMGKEQTCHPSDNWAPVLTASEYANKSGNDFLLALALAYAIEIKLINLLPVEQKGFDHTVQLAYSSSAGVSKALGFNTEQTANALAMSGCAFQGLAAVRSGSLSNWKGLASSMVALGVMNTAFLARRGVTGPKDVLEGKNGLMEAVGEKPKIEWDSSDLNLIMRVSLKPYNAEVHAQPSIEGVLDLCKSHSFTAGDVKKVDIETFRQAYNIVGDGDEAGDKYDVHTKEQADHSLPYVAAVAILDGEVTPKQYTPERIEREDVQNLLKKVTVHTQTHIGKKALGVLDTYTARYPDETPSKVTITLNDGREFICEKSDFRGFFSRPFSREDEQSKFAGLVSPFIDDSLRRELEGAVDNLENIPVRELTALLARVNAQGPDKDSSGK